LKVCSKAHNLCFSELIDYYQIKEKMRSVIGPVIAAAALAFAGAVQAREHARKVAPDTLIGARIQKEGVTTESNGEIKHVSLQTRNDGGNEGSDAAADDVQKEDLEYWGRFLQTTIGSMSMLQNPCDVILAIDCVFAATEIDCIDIPTTPPSDPDACGESVRFNYTVTNPTESPQTVASLIISRDGVTTDITNLLATTSLLPGESVTVVDIFDINICAGTTFFTAGTVTMDVPPVQPFCVDTDTYVF